MSSVQRVGVAASSEFLELDVGWPVLRAALTDAGIDPTVLVWDCDHRIGDDLDLVLVN